MRMAYENSSNQRDSRAPKGSDNPNEAARDEEKKEEEKIEEETEK